MFKSYMAQEFEPGDEVRNSGVYRVVHETTTPPSTPSRTADVASVAQKAPVVEISHSMRHGRRGRLGSISPVLIRGAPHYEFESSTVSDCCMLKPRGI
jgi:hypothetical protein